MSDRGEWPPPPWSGGGSGAGWQTDLGARTGVDGPVSAFGAPLARWAQRAGAMVLDTLLVGLVTTIVTLPFDHRSGSGTTDFSPALTIVSIALSAVYFSLLNGVGSGQTLGNRAPGIAVRDAVTGAPIGVLRSVLRWLVRSVLYAAFIVPGVVNDLFPLWDANRQTLADKAARSVMIRVR